MNNYKLDISFFYGYVFLLLLQVVKTCQFIHGILKANGRFPKSRYIHYATFEDLSLYTELELDPLEQENDYSKEDYSLSEEMPPVNDSHVHIERTGGRPV